MTTPKLKVQLHREWREIQVPNAPATYVRGDGSNSGRLQLSLAQFRQGALPAANEQLLLSICEKMTNGVRGLKELTRRSGACEFGMFGTVVAKGDFPVHVQVWVLSNKREFILVTHTCEKEPSSEEVTKANKIALMVGLS